MSVWGVIFSKQLLKMEFKSYLYFHPSTTPIKKSALTIISKIVAEQQQQQS